MASVSHDNARLLVTLLRRFGLEVVHAADGPFALGAARTAAGDPEFDLVLMDVQLPGIDGLEVTRRLRADGHAEPILALTAHAMATDHDACPAAGCDRVLTKPITPAALRSALAEWLPALEERGRAA